MYTHSTGSDLSLSRYWGDAQAEQQGNKNGRNGAPFLWTKIPEHQMIGRFANCELVPFWQSRPLPRCLHWTLETNPGMFIISNCAARAPIWSLGNSQRKRVIKSCFVVDVGIPVHAKNMNSGDGAKVMRHKRKTIVGVQSEALAQMVSISTVYTCKEGYPAVSWTSQYRWCQGRPRHSWSSDQTQSTCHTRNIEPRSQCPRTQE